MSKAAELEKRLKKEVDRAKSEKKKKEGARRSYRSEIATMVKNRWPELSNPWHPKTNRILRRDADTIVKVIKDHHKFKDLARINGEIGALSDKSFKIEKRWAKVKRLQRTLETIALAANLPQVASAEILARYEALVRLETADLTGPFAPPAAAVTQ
jgi:hypothetical protein